LVKVEPGAKWNGKAANRFEKLKACQTLADMAAKTGRPKKIIVEQGRSHEALIGKSLEILSKTVS